MGINDAGGSPAARGPRRPKIGQHPPGYAIVVRTGILLHVFVDGEYFTTEVDNQLPKSLTMKRYWRTKR